MQPIPVVRLKPRSLLHFYNQQVPVRMCFYRFYISDDCLWGPAEIKGSEFLYLFVGGVVELFTFTKAVYGDMGNVYMIIKEVVQAHPDG